MVIAAAPPRRVSGQSGRAAPHIVQPRKLSLDQESAIRVLAQTKSLRSLAADFGVSHETVRRVVLRNADKIA